MTQFEKLDLLLRECGGTIQTFQVLNNGISKSVFYAYVKERGLEQAAHGVYVSPDTWTDAMYLLHLRCGQAVFSHETALFFHDLTDREPLFNYDNLIKAIHILRDRYGLNFPTDGITKLFRGRGAGVLRAACGIWKGKGYVCCSLRDGE